MKRSILLVIMISLFLTGCQNSYKGHTPGKLMVDIQGAEQLPDFLVGKWDSGKAGWEFTFEKDGTISEAMIALGMTIVIPGKISKVPTRDGGQAVYVPGDWTVTYNAEARELTVDVVMDYIRVEIGEGVLLGKSQDTITGFVSHEGLQWDVVIMSTPEFELLPNRPEDLPYISEGTFKKIQN